MSKKCAIAQRHSPSGLSSKLSICLSSTCPVMLHPSFRTCNLLPSPCSQNCVTLGLSLRSPFLPKCPAHPCIPLFAANATLPNYLHADSPSNHFLRWFKLWIAFFLQHAYLTLRLAPRNSCFPTWCRGYPAFGKLCPSKKSLLFYILCCPFLLTADVSLRLRPTST